MAGHIRGIVIIPRRFGEKLRQGEIKPLEVITDGSEPNTANFVQNYAQGVWAVWFGQHQALTGGTLTPTPDSETRIWYNPELESRHFLLPGALALIMTLIGTLLTALVISREWERGTMEALLSTAVTRGELLLGKLVPYFLLGMLSLTLSVAAIILVFHVPFRGASCSSARRERCSCFRRWGWGFSSRPSRKTSSSPARSRFWRLSCRA